jgi:hypothetical protein
MNNPVQPQVNLAANEEYRLIPIHPAGETTPLRICVLVRAVPDPAEGSFYLLRDLPDARVYLGAVADVGGRVREWLELWFQNIDGLAAALSAYREHFNNAFLDQRWIQQSVASRALMAKAGLETGWETRHPPPAFIDLNTRVWFQPENAGERFELCCDDAALQAAGLPPFSTSLFRYLWQPALGKASRFVPVTAHAPETDATQPMAEILAGHPAFAPLNPQGGLIRVARYYPLGIQDYIEVLGGQAWEGATSGLKPVKLGLNYQSLETKERARNLGAHLFLGAQGRAGRFLEAFHLKLQLMAAAISQTQTYVAKTQLPLLNLSVDSFRVELGDLDPGLPLLWTARCALIKPGQAGALPVKTTSQRYFIRLGAAQPSIYQPEGLGLPLPGVGTVRLRKVFPPEREGTVIEGTLALAEPRSISPRDLLWIRMPLLASRIDLYAHAYTEEGMARGEIRFRTLPQTLSEAVLAGLRTAEGVPFSRCAFEVVPLLSSPCDLYALGVLAVRAFLVDQKNTLAVAVDEVFSLARQAALTYQADLPLADRIRALFEQDPRWRVSLGPRHLPGEEIAPEAAAQLLPAPLWMDTLAAIVRLFPGLGPDSWCRDMGDAPALALETIFTAPLAAWQNLLLRSRSLIVIDWACNREIHAAIATFKE